MANIKFEETVVYVPDEFDAQTLESQNHRAKTVNLLFRTRLKLWAERTK